MTIPASLVRRALLRRALRAGLLLGALYDLGFAALMLAAPQIPMRMLALPLPGETFYLSVLAVLLAIVACCYLLAAWDPERYTAVIVIAIAGRAAGAIALAASAGGRPELAGLWPLAGADAAFALLHLGTWWPVRT
jgi:hypothetical protein